MNITQFALERRQLSILVILFLVVLGGQSYFEIPRAQDPGFIIRTAQVMTYFPGASPERVEELVSDKIEEKIRQMPELDFVTSENKTGVSIIRVNIKESYKDMRPIWDSLRRKVEESERDLPDGVSKPIVNDEFGDTQRGLERMLPAAFRNLAKGYRYMSEDGIYTRRGDPILDDVSASGLFFQFLGFPPAEYTRVQEQNQVKKACVLNRHD